jgi:di/tricarboxylate transporter
MEEYPAFSLDPMAPSPDQCPCMRNMRRRLEEEDAPVWQTVVVSVSLFFMFLFMMMDWIGPDWVMAAGLTLFMVCEIVTIREGLQGFSNEGILTVMSLFVVADGISRTGMLDHYLQIIMGKPKTVAGAQIRLMIPIATLSAFLNNTPIVAVMIPLTLRWARTIGVPVTQLLIPLSYATILGGTCTLVGTSTNIVLQGLLQEDYPDEPAGNIGLFDVGVYGVPNAMIGIAYMLIFAPFLLPDGGGTTSAELQDLLLGARVTAWSPAAGRTVKRSGLGDSGGIYLVNVRRGATGNLHHAVSDDFVISVGDELFFTGVVEEFAAFCDKNGLEIITNNSEPSKYDEAISIKADVGTTKETTLALDEHELLQIVNRIVDQIHDKAHYDLVSTETRIILATEAFNDDKLLLVGIDTLDRPGLLMDISKNLLQNGLQLRHSEARVIADRSLSVWRCQGIKNEIPDVGDLWSSLSALLQTPKATGKQLIRAVVTKTSTLIAQKPENIDFQAKYKAAVVAYQKEGRNVTLDKELAAGNLLVLEVLESSPLLLVPPSDFYKSSKGILPSSSGSSNGDYDVEADASVKAAWSDLHVLFNEENVRGVPNRGTPKGEFLTAFVITPHSSLKGKTVSQTGYSRLQGINLVKVERPVTPKNGKKVASDISSETSEKQEVATLTIDDPLEAGDLLWFSGSAEAISDLKKEQGFVLYVDDQSQKATSVLQDRRLVQAVVARGSPLVGYTIKELRFRSQYGGAVIAIQRGGGRIRGHPASVKLQTGDVLLVEAGPSFTAKQGQNYKTFALLSEVQGSSPPRPRLFLLCVAGIIASLTVAALEIRSLLITSAIVGIFMVSFGVVTQQEARDAIQWDLFVVLASAFGVGNAMSNSGVASGLAKFIVKAGKSLGIGGMLVVSSSVMYLSYKRINSQVCYCNTFVIVEIKMPVFMAGCTLLQISLVPYLQTMQQLS